MRNLLLIMLPVFADIARAQHVVIGLGQLECIHTGITYPLSSRFWGLTTLGVGLPMRQQQVVALGQKFILTSIPAKRASNKLTFGAGFSLTAWYLNNRWNVFQNLSAGPELQLGYRPGRAGMLTAYAGWLWNNVLYYRRKTWEEVGWPRNWQPSFGIRWQFNRAR